MPTANPTADPLLDRRFPMREEQRHAAVTIRRFDETGRRHPPPQS